MVTGELERLKRRIHLGLFGYFLSLLHAFHDVSHPAEHTTLIFLWGWLVLLRIAEEISTCGCPGHSRRNDETIHTDSQEKKTSNFCDGADHSQ